VVYPQSMLALAKYLPRLEVLFYTECLSCPATCILQESLVMDHGVLEMKAWSLPALARDGVLEKIGVRACCSGRQAASTRGAADGVEVPVGAQHGARSRGRLGWFDVLCAATPLSEHSRWTSFDCVQDSESESDGDGSVYSI